MRRAPKPRYVALAEGVLPDAIYRVGKLLQLSPTQGFVDCGGYGRHTLSTNEFTEITEAEYSAALDRVNRASDATATALAEKLEAEKKRKIAAMDPEERSARISEIRNELIVLAHRSLRYDNRERERELQIELGWLEKIERDAILDDGFGKANAQMEGWASP